MPGGYHNRFIDIDLAKETFDIGEPDPELQQKFIGGKGFGLALLCKLDTSEDPFDPENPMIILTGPLTGSSITTSNRSCVVTRSPLTGGFLDSHAGGHSGTGIKLSGYDYTIIKGKSSRPVYVHITSKGAEFSDASHLWGKGCFETENTLKQKHPNGTVMSIGPAGENLVRYACITTELYRQYGRGGAGAVMGSKNLKAVVFEGDEKVRYHDEARFRELSKQVTKDIVEHPVRALRVEYGTTMWVRKGHEEGGFLPTSNWRKGRFDDYEKITSEVYNKDFQWKAKGCHNCVIQCSKVAYYDGKELEGPEYETAAYLGSNCELSDPKDLLIANELCDDLGLDSISTGGNISFIMEAAEKGLLSPEENEWIKFGSGEAIHRLIKMIASREGIGDTLAESTRRASRHIGNGSEYFAMQIAGMELSGVNPMGCYSHALALATSDFASHTRVWTATDEMVGNLTFDMLPGYIKKGQDNNNVKNCVIVCDFFMLPHDRLAPMIEAATGIPTTTEGMFDIGERIHSLARLYNLRTGRTHADDTLPERMFTEPILSNMMKGKVIDRDFFEGQLQKYYKIRGWDEEGRPTKETLERLGISQF
jgi:aldehyde:ferredoxin oxidoreductase